MESTDPAHLARIAVHTLSGAVAKGADFVRPGGLSSAYQDSLVLRGTTTRIAPEVLGRSAEARIGTGSIGYGNADILTLRLQVDDRQLCWLADPADSDVWAMLDNWRKAGVALVGLDVPPAGIAMLKIPAGSIGADARTFFDAGSVPSVSEVMEAMGAHISTGSLVENATSDIPAHKSLASLEVMVLMSSRMEQFIRDDGGPARHQTTHPHLH